MGAEVWVGGKQIDFEEIAEQHSSAERVLEQIRSGGKIKDWILTTLYIHAGSGVPDTSERQRALIDAQGCLQKEFGTRYADVTSCWKENCGKWQQQRERVRPHFLVRALRAVIRA